jgi:putative membrane protein
MRHAFLLFGVLALVAAWIAPLPQLGRHAFWVHMTMHVVVVAIAAPLLALGMAGGKLDPVPRVPKLLSPIPVSIVELIVVWAWHAPLLHHFARHTNTGFVAEQSTFLLTGTAMWLSAFGGDSKNAGSRRAAGIIGLLLTSMHMTLLGALLALAPRPLFHHAHSHSRLTPLDDQHLGGAIMLLVGGISYLAGGLWLTVALIRARQIRVERSHDQPMV